LKFQHLLPSLLVLALIAGCPEDEPGGPDGGGGGRPAADGGTIGEDAGPPRPPVVRKTDPSQTITSGGGYGGNSNYRVRVIIGGPTAAGSEGESPTHRVELGAGATQHRP